MERLYLVGTHHMDLKGPERLGKFLDFVRPDVIGVEITKSDFTKRMDDHKSLDSQLVLLNTILCLTYGREKATSIISFLKMLGYELWVPLQYKARTGTPLLFCDQTIDANELTSLSKSVFGDRVDDQNKMTPKFLDDLTKTDFVEYQSGVDRTYVDSDIGGLANDPERFDLLLKNRDTFIETRIREAFNGDGSTFVYIGGVLHFYGDYHPNLFDRLADLNPIKILLPEIDKFG